MPAVKMVPIHDSEGNVVDRRFEASNSFTTAVAKNRMPMVRPDGRTVNVNRKLQARGHYDDKHAFVTPEQHRMASAALATVTSDADLTPGQLRTAPARAAAAAKREENAK